jgi:hypothetical protein
MEGLTVTTTFDRDDPQHDEGELYGTTVMFKFFVNETQFGDMFLSEPHMFTSHDYLEIINENVVAALLSKPLDFCNSNGGVSIIQTAPSTLAFKVSKFGAGGDGGITIKVPLERCRQALLDVAAWRAKFE